MKSNNFYIEKNSKTKDTVYIEFDKIDGYKITPKVKKEDAIEVNKIVFVSPTLSEKIIKIKIDHRMTALINFLEELTTEGSDEGSIRKNLMDAERLKLMIINNYTKYLGHTYQSLTLKKIQLIINNLREALAVVKENTYEEKRGRGR